MGFWLVIAWIAVTIASSLLRPRPKIVAPEPSSLGELIEPTADEGRTIPVLWGTGWLRAPNVLWAGDFVTKTTKQNGQVVGYRYFMGQQLGLCHGVLDELVNVLWDERPIPGSTITIDGTNDTLVFGNDPFTAGAWRVLKMPHGQHTYTQLQQDLTAEMTNVLSGDGYFGVAIYGYHIVAGWNDQVVYKILGVDGAGQVATMNPGFYESRQAMAVEVARAINAKEALRGGGAQMNVTGAVNGYLLQWTGVKLGGAGTGWELEGGGNNANGRAAYTIGLITGLGSSVTGFPGTINGYRPTAPKRWKLLVGTLAGNLAMRASWRERIASIVGPYTLASGPPTTSNMLNTLGFLPRGNWPGSTPDWDPDTNPLGMDPLVDKIMADFDVETSGLTISDLGDWWRVSVLESPSGGFFVNLLNEIRFEIGGQIDVYKGTQTQTANDYLQSKMVNPCPAYLGIAYAVLRGFHVANQPYLKPISFIARRCPNQLGLTGGKHNIAGDANPACMIYEAITDATWGSGLPTTMVDAANFQAVGDTLFDEGFGLSMVVDAPASATDLIRDILRHIDGTLYTDPTTGKLKLKLIRPDYNPLTIPVLDETNCEVESYERSSWADTRNAIKVRYVDRAWGFTERIVEQHDAASITSRGEIVTEDADFRGLSNATIATKIAYRELKTLATPPGRPVLIADRSMHKLRPGDPFIWNSPDHGVSGMPCRVAQIIPGPPQDGKIRIDAVEDPSALLWATFTPPGSPGGGIDWTPVSPGSGWGFNWGGDWGA